MCEMLHESMLISILRYESKTLVWNEKKVAQKNNLRAMIGIRRRGGRKNKKIGKQVCVCNEVDEVINESGTRSHERNGEERVF